MNVTAAEKYHKLWEYGNDNIGTVSLFRCKSPESFKILGDIVESGSVSQPTDLVPTFYPMDIFTNPISFTLIWFDNTCSFWRAVPPSGFVVSEF